MTREEYLEKLFIDTCIKLEEAKEEIKKQESISKTSIAAYKNSLVEIEKYKEQIEKLKSKLEDTK